MKVPIQLQKGNAFKLPKFSECVVDFFSKGAQSVNVTCEVKDDMCTITLNESGYPLQHAPECPVRLFAEMQSAADNAHKLNSKMKFKSVPLAVSVVIESSDNALLLTKRASHMRTHPRVWVLPGGHLEPGETIFEGGAREVKEEIGLDISHENPTVLGLWESVNPLLIELGTPTSHAVVFYFYVKLKETSSQLQKQIIPDPDEVQAWMWMSASTMRQCLKNTEIDFIQKYYVIENDKLIEKEFVIGTMFYKILWVKDLPYSGVHFAIRQWFERFEKHRCKF